MGTAPEQSASSSSRHFDILKTFQEKALEKLESSDSFALTFSFLLDYSEDYYSQDLNEFLSQHFSYFEGKDCEPFLEQFDEVLGQISEENRGWILSEMKKFRKDQTWDQTV